MNEHETAIARAKAEVVRAAVQLVAAIAPDEGRAQALAANLDRYRALERAVVNLWYLKVGVEPPEGD